MYNTCLTGGIPERQHPIHHKGCRLCSGHADLLLTNVAPLLVLFDSEIRNDNGDLETGQSGLECFDSGQ